MYYLSYHIIISMVLYCIVLQSISRFTGLQFTGLPCLLAFFFRATPSPRFTGGMPVYRGGSVFHAREAPPAAAHSHTRCCTQHNTTRWVLRAAANTCLHTMPCAAGELCQLSDSTTTPEFSCCGPCGGRLHRICGDPDDDEEVNHICEPCAAAKKSTSSTNDHSNAAKRKEGGGILQQSAPKKRKGETRKRLTLGLPRQQEKHRHAISKSVEIHLLFLCTCGRFPRYTGTCRYTGLPVCPVYRLFLVLPLQAGKSGHRLYTLLNYLAGADLSLNMCDNSYCTVFQDHVYICTCKSPLVMYLQPLVLPKRFDMFPP